MESRFVTMISRIKVMSGLTFTSGRMAPEGTQAETIHPYRGEENDMERWNALVEATIDAIRVNPMDKEVQIEVTCAWEGNARKKIVATGVDDFIVSDMRLSNIIDRVDEFSEDNAKDENGEIAKLLFFLMREREATPSDMEWPALKEKLACIRDGTLSLLKIEPVYGATIAILAVEFRLEPIV